MTQPYEYLLPPRSSPPARSPRTLACPPSVLVSGLIFMFLAVLTWAGAVSSSMIAAAPAHPAWLGAMAVWVLLCLGTSPVQTVQRLQQLWAVSVGRQLPQALLQQALRDHRWVLATTTGLAAVALASMAAVVALPLGVSSRPALALALAAGAVLFMAWQLVLAGTLHGVVRLATGWSLALALGGACLAGGIDGQWLRAPVALHLSALLSLPLACGWVHHGLSRRGPAHSHGLPAATTWQRLALWRVSLQQRFQKVDAGLQLSVFGGFFYQLPSNMTNAAPDARVLQPWGSSLTWAHGLRLAVLTAAALMLLRVASPHWRYMLAPGGQILRRRLGWHMFGTTLLAWSGWWLFLLLATALVHAFMNRHSADLFGISQLLPLALPLLSDLLLSTAAAVWLRAAAGTPGRAVGTLCGVTMAGGLALGLAIAAGVQPWPLAPLGHRGPSWLAGQAALTAGFLLLAHPAWARVDLHGQLIRRR